jgi:hypothetical protein
VTEFVIEIIGWVGSVLVLLAYALNSYQKLKSDSLWFMGLNFTGAAFLIVYTVIKHAYASAFVNVVWIIIAVIGIIRYFRQHKR